MTAQIAFDNSYARLPDRFYVRQNPVPVARPGLIRVNESLAKELGIDPKALSTPEGIDILAGNRIAQGSEPLAQAYAGHQFGGWSPQLGDGRAVLLGEVIDQSGTRRDIQLKGSGPTPFSRMGDGRAWLGPVLREYVVSEAMQALGIPTTRSLAAVTTGEQIQRERRQPGAVLTRVARSHIRVGTFQYFAARGDTEALRLLMDHVIARHYPEAETPLDLLAAVTAAQADLIARWMGVGFIHGVMNTDNMSIAGETIDYGPCAFIDAYHPETVFSSIDQFGRYAYQNQPQIAVWNLAQFASCLIPLMGEDSDAAVRSLTDVINGFPDLYTQNWLRLFRAKFGLTTEAAGDAELLQDLLTRMATNQADFTLTFRRLSELGDEAKDDEPVRALFVDPTAFDGWALPWRARLAHEGSSARTRQPAMRATNPAYIARNHRVEQMIEAAVDGDNGPFERLSEILAQPFDDQPRNIAYQSPPTEAEIVTATFCGT